VAFKTNLNKILQAEFFIKKAGFGPLSMIKMITCYQAT